MRLVAVGGGLLLLDAVALLTGLLRPAAAEATAVRTLPVLGFVAAIAIVAALAAEAGLFAWIADGAARAARGSAWALWGLVVAVAIASTIVLSLDTTAVLLTPIVVVLARRAGLPVAPFALTTVWLANTGSLLLPVSNLTNLLAETAAPLRDVPYLALSPLPALACAAVPVALIALIHRRALSRRFEPGPATPPEDRALRTVAAVVVGVLVPVLALSGPLGLPVWIPALAGAVALVVATALRRRAALRLGLVPWPLLLFAAGLFLAVDAAGRLGLSAVLGAAAGTGADLPALLRLAGVGALLTNAVDNLPAYLAMEPTAGSPARLLALLVAVNAAPLVTPWASLANLLWHERLASLGEAIPWSRFALLGLLAAPLTVAAGVLAVWAVA